MEPLGKAIRPSGAAAAAAVDSVLPLRMDELWAPFWKPLPQSAKEALRGVNRRMRHEADECIRGLVIELTTPDALLLGSSRLSTCPNLEKLSLNFLGSFIGLDVSSLFSSVTQSSCKIKWLEVSSPSRTSLGVAHLPPRLQESMASLKASLVSLDLMSLKLDGPFFAPLVVCTALREIGISNTPFISPEAANSLMLLTQVRRVGSTLADEPGCGWQGAHLQDQLGCGWQGEHLRDQSGWIW